MKPNKKDNKYFKEFYYHDCNACENKKIKSIYSAYKRAGRDLVLNQIIPELSKLETYEIDLNDLTFYSFSDNEISRNKVKEIIEFCIYKIKLFNTDQRTFWSIRVLQHKLNRLKKNKDKSDKVFYGRWHPDDPEIINPKYQTEIDNICEILSRPLYCGNTPAILQYDKNENCDTTVLEEHEESESN